MIIKKLSTWVFVITLTSASYALELKPVIELNMANPKISPEVSGVENSARGALGIGALVEMGLFPMWSLESGLLFTPYGQKTTISALNITTEASFYMLQIPIVARLHILPFLSLGAGGYTAFALGSTSKVKTTVGTAPAAESEVPLDSAAKSDFGLLASIAATLPVGSSTWLFLDLRYRLGLKNMTSTSGSTQKFNHVEILAGISFNLI